MNKKNLNHPFNGTIECGLRALVLLECIFPNVLDIQRLVYYDYLMVHSGDAGGPESIHPATPHRSGEILLKRQILEDGMLLMISRDLIERHYYRNGIKYVASNSATWFLNLLASPYVELLKSRAAWVVDNFEALQDNELETYFNANLEQWGGEFEKEALLKYVSL